MAQAQGPFYHAVVDNTFLLEKEEFLKNQKMQGRILP